MSEEEREEMERLRHENKALHLQVEFLVAYIQGLEEAAEQQREDKNQRLSLMRGNKQIH